MEEKKREYSVLGEWLIRELESYMEERKLSLRDVASQVSLPYTTLWKSYRGERNLKDYEVERLLSFLGYRLSFERKEITFQVCRTMKTDCEEPLYEIPVCTRVHIDGTPDLQTRVDTFFFHEKVYAVRVSDSRATPFHHKSLIVGYVPDKEVSGEGFYLFYAFEPGQGKASTPVLREVVMRGSQAFFKLYCPEDFEPFMDENYRVIGRVKSLTVQGF